MVAFHRGSCIWKRWLEPPRNQASTAHRGSGMHPTADFPGSSAGSDPVVPGQFSAVPPVSAISSANRLGPPSDAAENRVRFYHLNYASKVRPQPYQSSQYRTVDTTQAQSSRRLPQGNAELVAQEEILDHKPTMGLEQVRD